MILFLRRCNQRLRLEQGSQSNVARSVWQHEDRSPAPATHAKTADQETVLSAAGDIIKKRSVC